MDGKSILLAHLPDDPRLETKIIIDTFERFYRISKSTLNLSGQPQKERDIVLNYTKKKLREIHAALLNQYHPFLDVKQLCQELIRLDIKALDQFKLRWPKERLNRFHSHERYSILDTNEFINSLLQLYDEKADGLQQVWFKIKENCKQHEELMDKECDPVFKPKESLENLIQSADDLDVFNKEWSGIKKALTPIIKKYHPSEIGKLVEDLQGLLDKSREKQQIWIQHSIIFLENLLKDISLVNSTVVDDWNYEILMEVVHWIQFIYDFFDRLQGTLTLPPETEERFSEVLDEVEGELRVLYRDFIIPKQNDINSQDISEKIRGMVSAKTVPELYILNALSKRLLNGSLRYKEQIDVQKLTIDIEKVFTELQNHVQEPNEIRKGLAWVPTMIAVVLDPNTRFLLTGASQPSCKGHPILREAASKIPRWQLGHEFASIIAGCYDFWKNNQCVELRKRHSEKLETLQNLKGHAKEKYSKEFGTWSDQDLKSLFPTEKPQRVYNQLPAAATGSKITCWAISGTTFELKSPCPRCAYFYPSWDLYQTDEFTNVDYLLNYLNSGMSDAKEAKDFHCAETVAAAQIYAWGYETLGFT